MWSEERSRAVWARMVLRQIAPAFLYDPRYRVNVIDFGLPERQQSTDERPTLRFHVTEKMSEHRLESAGIERVPRQIGEFTTDVIEGVYYPQVWPWWPAVQPPAGSPQSRFEKLRGGISISDVRHISAGTLGGLVRDRATGEEMILSNWHVLVVEWWARPGLRICQPGRLDGGLPHDVVARLTRDAMRSGLDAAVATLTGHRALINDQLTLGPVDGVARPELGMQLVKAGRTTGVTHGIVTGIEGYARLWYGSVQRVIRHVMTIVPAVTRRDVSKAGDSGSWWLDEATNNAVGLHFAGSDSPEQGLAMDMTAVLDALGVDVVTERPLPAARRWIEAARMEVMRR
ncbi:MAG: hypothetical protein HXY39_06400 [Chloroflexi bacterium]|nr:hypothetical protein [Chloroflexota bacterium]